MMDVGCYAIHWIRTICGQEPQVVRAEAVEGPTGVDVSMDALVRLPPGYEFVVRASITVGPPSTPAASHFYLEGSYGRLRVVNPMAPQLGNRLQATIADGQDIDEVLDGRTSYYYQLRAFEQCVSGEDEPITGGIDAIANMVVIDSIYLAARLPIRG